MELFLKPLCRPQKENLATSESCFVFHQGASQINNPPFIILYAYNFYVVLNSNDEDVLLLP